MSRRGAGEGTIRQRSDGRWEARTRLDGERISVYGATRREAAGKLREAQERHRHGIRSIGSMPFGQYLDQWIASERPPRSNIRLSTWKRYEQAVRLYLKPHLGRIAVEKLQPDDLADLYSELLEDLAPGSVHNVHSVARRALSVAVRKRRLLVNVATLVQAPNASESVMNILTEEQRRQLLEACRDDRLEALYVLAAAHGFRLGELLALKWDAIDLQAGTASVISTLAPGKGGPTFQAPKTQRGKRQVFLGQVARAALARQRDRWEEAVVRPSLGLVFTTQKGQPLDHSEVTRRYLPALLGQAGLPRIRFHDLRHTAVTLALARGINPKVVSEMVGHASVAFTLDRYGHVLPTMQEEAAAAIDVSLGGQVGGQSLLRSVTALTGSGPLSPRF